MHPSILTNGGPRAAIEALADARRFPDHIEAGAHFLVAEALINAAKHAHASRVDVDIAAGDGVLEIRVRDERSGDEASGRGRWIGGADRAGSGMRGLEDRVEALGGTFRLASPKGGGTAIRATLPLPG